MKLYAVQWKPKNGKRWYWVKNWPDEEPLLHDRRSKALDTARHWNVAYTARVVAVRLEVEDEA